MLLGGLLIPICIVELRKNRIKLTLNEVIIGAGFAFLACTGILSNEIKTSDSIATALLILKIFAFFIFCKFAATRNFNINHATSSFIYYSALISTTAYIIIYLLKIDILPEIEIEKLKTYGYITGAYGNDIPALANTQRNSGYFYEPGVFSIFLNFALINYLFMQKSMPKSAILTIITISTFSIFGVLVATVSWTIYLIKNNKSSSNLLIAIFATSLIFFVFALDPLEKTETTSYELRSSDVDISIDLYAEKPLFGWGLLNDAKFKELNLTNHLIDRASSNGWLSLLYQGGTFMFTLISILSIRSILPFSNWPARLAMLSWLLFSLLSQNLLFSYFFSTFILFNNLPPAKKLNT